MNELGLVGFREPFARLFHQGWVRLGGSKMSKSRGNVTAPDQLAEMYGADAVRLFILFMRPADIKPEESSYLDRVASDLGQLNLDLSRETQSPAPPGALAQMRQDFDRVTADLLGGTPPKRLTLYRDTRVKGFLANFDLILSAEESAAQGQNAQTIHSSAYEDHRRYYYQEARVTRLIGYLYLQVPNQPFSDDQLSTVNWAVF